MRAAQQRDDQQCLAIILPYLYTLMSAHDAPRLDAGLVGSVSAAQRILDRCMAFATSLQIPSLQSLSSQIQATRSLQTSNDTRPTLDSNKFIDPETVLRHVTTALQLNTEQTLLRQQPSTNFLASAAYEMFGLPSLATIHAMIPLNTDIALDNAVAYAASAKQVRCLHIRYMYVSY